MSRKWFRRLWILICYVLNFIGCAAQLYYISEQYFKYGTVTELSIKRQDRLRPPQLIICLQAKDFIHDYKDVPSLFQLSPNASRLINLNESSIRDGNGWLTDERKFYSFKVAKVFKSGSLCYSIHVNHSLVFSARQITNGRKYPSIYHLTLNYNFRTAKDFLIYTHHPLMSWYGDSDSFAIHNRILNKSQNIIDYNQVGLSYSTFKLVRLPAPYQTNCIDYVTIGYESYANCFEYCIGVLCAKMFGKNPYYLYSTEISTLPFLRNRDMKRNKTILIAMRDIEKECRIKCAYTDCDFEQIVPKKMVSTNSTFPIFELLAPNEPYVISEYKPQVQLVDFVTASLSCLGFWLAWSPLDFLLKIQFSKIVSTVRMRGATDVNRDCNQQEVIANQDDYNFDVHKVIQEHAFLIDNYWEVLLVQQHVLREIALKANKCVHKH